MSDITIYTHCAGPLDNLMYIISSGDTTYSIDPAWDVPHLTRILQQQGKTLSGILLTHEHFDHVIGVPELLSTPVPVYLSEQAVYRPPVAMQQIFVNNQTRIPLGDHTIAVIETPGHSPGGVCYYVGNRLITGDTVFINGCGRTDLPGSDPEALYDSLINRLWDLPDDTVLYPGHDYGPTRTDTWGNQKRTNPFLNSSDPLRFIKRL